MLRFAAAPASRAAASVATSAGRQTSADPTATTSVARVHAASASCVSPRSIASAASSRPLTSAAAPSLISAAPSRSLSCVCGHRMALVVSRAPAERRMAVRWIACSMHSSQMQLRRAEMPAFCPQTRAWPSLLVSYKTLAADEAAFWQNESQTTSTCALEHARATLFASHNCC